MRVSLPGSARWQSQMKHIPRKRFGQHFLADQAIVDAIVRAIDPRPGQAMVEIGPGLAALTQPLVERLGKLAVIELDRDLAARLRLHTQLVVIEADVLKVNFDEVAQSLGTPKVRVVGNLPYNISTPILFHLLDFVERIDDQHFMLQKEVIDRMVARPATSDYGRLSVMLQWRYEMENVLFVPPTAFDPPPRVDSAVVRMVPRSAAAPVDAKVLSELVQVAFSQRRKILRHTLGKWLEQKNFGGQFDIQRRAEEVPVEEYLALALTPALAEREGEATRPSPQPSPRGRGSKPLRSRTQ
jgi:16S rRNA (adenine1518-N6/adenine1519-N6)-dimethyltransferase